MTLTEQEVKELLSKFYIISKHSKETGDWELWHEVVAVVDDAYWLVTREKEKAAASPNRRTRH
jgi:hypothetical protein